MLLDFIILSLVLKKIVQVFSQAWSLDDFVEKKRWINLIGTQETRSFFYYPSQLNIVLRLPKMKDNVFDVTVSTFDVSMKLHSYSTAWSAIEKLGSPFVLGVFHSIRFSLHVYQIKLLNLMYSGYVIIFILITKFIMLIRLLFIYLLFVVVQYIISLPRCYRTKFYNLNVVIQ